MIGDFLLRLAIALPVVLLLAVALMLAMKRGLLPVPAMNAGRPRRPFLAGADLRALSLPWRAGRVGGASDPGTATDCPRLDLVANRSILPGLRILVVRYAGHDLVLGAGPQGLSLLSLLPAPVSGAALPDSAAGGQP